jgi:hypothetical protein
MEISKPQRSFLLVLLLVMFKVWSQIDSTTFTIVPTTTKSVWGGRELSVLSATA